MNDAVAGHVDLAIGSSALLAAYRRRHDPAADADRETRYEAFKDVPTAAEAGFPGLAAQCLVGGFCARQNPGRPAIAVRTALVDSLREEAVAKKLVESQQVSIKLGNRRRTEDVPCRQWRPGAPWCATTTSARIERMTRLRIAILDDSQNVAFSAADWSALQSRCEIVRFAGLSPGRRCGAATGRVRDRRADARAHALHRLADPQAPA